MWKGKARATEQDFDDSDINPTLTYRHILSHALGVKDPFRTIALCDMDAFYASCEMVRLKIDPSKPLVVSQWDALIAVNYPARKFGISRMDKAKDALKRCPELIVIHVQTYREGDAEPAYHPNPDTKTHKVSLDHYRRESQTINKLFSECLPEGAEIERASIDESFIDFTRPVREKLLRLYPHLAHVPEGGAETSLPPPPPIIWDELGNLIPVYPQTDDSVEGERAPNGDIEAKEAAIPTTWHDVALSIAAAMMKSARDEIRTKLGYSTSAGVARNKFLAKLSASYVKGNSQSVLRNAAIPAYLRPMKFQKIRMLGGKLGNAIAQEYEASTVAELLHIGLDEMQRKFGEESIWVYEVIRGIDRSEVKEKPSMTKSMGASKNLPKPIMKPSEGASWLRVLAAELSLRLKDARDLSPNLWPKTIRLGIRQGWTSSRTVQAPFPFVREVTTEIVAAAGEKLWKDIFGTSDNKHPEVNVTHLSLAFGGVETGEANQQGIQGFLAKPTSGAAKPQSASRKRKVIEKDGDLEEKSHSPTEKTEEYFRSFTCKRCRKTFKLPEHLIGPDIDEETRKDALAMLQNEHSDFHFAQDLSKAPEPAPVVSAPKSGKAKKKKKAEPEGIAKFFLKQ